MAIINLRIIRKTTETTESERILEETVWKQMKIFGISVINRKVHYQCNLVKRKQKIGFETK